MSNEQNKVRILALITRDLHFNSKVFLPKILIGVRLSSDRKNTVVSTKVSLVEFIYCNFKYAHQRLTHANNKISSIHFFKEAARYVHEHRK